VGNRHGWNASFAKAGVAGSNPAGGTKLVCSSTTVSGRLPYSTSLLPGRCLVGDSVALDGVVCLAMV
jgi:hypothetical protein